MRLASKDKQAQVRALEELYIDLISCVQRADVQLAVSKHCKKKQLLMNSGGRVERINGGFIRKWGNQYVKYWLALAELRDEGPDEGSHDLYRRKQRMIVRETGRLIADLQIGVTSEMDETIKEMLHHEFLHEGLLALPE